MLELATIETFTDWLHSPLQDTRPPAAVQALDLRGFKDSLNDQNFRGSLFLSCTLCRDSTFAIIKAGGVIIPDSPTLTSPAHRGAESWCLCSSALNELLSRCTQGVMW